MLLGFISLLLTVGQSVISNICVSKEIGNTWHPCGKEADEDKSAVESESDGSEDRRRLLSIPGFVGGSRRVLAAAGEDKCAAKARSIKFSICCFLFLISFKPIHVFFLLLIEKI